MNKTPVWIDDDCGIDDAMAIFTACKLDNIEIVGASAVGGNADLKNTFRNTRNILNFAGRSDVKVYAGAQYPLLKNEFECIYFHGKNGLGDVEIEESKAPVETENAWDALYETAKKYNGLTVCVLGPLTNIAIAIAKHPDIVNYIKEINVMGGALNDGNATPCAEFNIYHDAQAAENVFKSGIHINMFGLDATLKTTLTQKEIDRIASQNTKVGDLYSKMVKTLQQSCAQYNELPCIHDVCPVLYIAHPEVFTGQDCGIYVETQGTITYGKTVADLWTDFKYEDRHCTAFYDLDREKFFDLLNDMVASY